jgi:hypothetical protein
MASPKKRKKKKSCVTRASDVTLLSVEGCEEQKKSKEEKPNWEGQ